jgi:hypothetical protein
MRDRLVGQDAVAEVETYGPGAPTAEQLLDTAVQRRTAGTQQQRSSAPWIGRRT